MAKQILNRREPIYAEELPAEIADTSGFIEATDYATDTTGGTVKIDEDYGVELTTAGFLRGTVETAEDYAEAGNNLLVSKGTLDAVLAAQPAPQTGGLTKLYERNSESPVKLNTAVTLSETSANYPALLVVIRGAAGGYAGKGFSFVIPTFAQGVTGGTFGTFADMTTGTNITRLVMKVDGTSLAATYSDTDMEWQAVYGIK